MNIPLREVCPQNVRKICKLGEGSFGVVHKVTWKKGDQIYEVAMKVLKDSAHLIQELTREVNLWSVLGYHRHVVSLYGYNFRTPSPFILMEYVEGQDLLHYLFALRESLCGCGRHRNVLPQDLNSFALQMARGLAHLEHYGIVHRDLAARNVLLSTTKILKITDFGFTRQGPYMVHSNMLPVRWMPPEALSAERIHTTKSDVWSFGIVLWEIGTLGGLPYVDIPDECVRSTILRGVTCGRPQNVTNSLYQLMVHCWAYDQNKRPSFRSIVQSLGSEVSAANFVVFSISQQLPTRFYVLTGSGVDSAMNQSAMSAAKIKPSYRILFAGNDGSPTTNNIVRKANKVGRPRNNPQSNVINDLDAAVNSITGEIGTDDNHQITIPAMRKNYTAPNIVTLNTGDTAGNKLSKIVFLPQFVQKKVQVLDQKKIIKREIPTPIKQNTPVLHKPRVSLIDQKDRDFSTPKRRKLGDIALESWSHNKKAEITPPPIVEPPPLDETQDNVKVMCRLCGIAVEEEIIELVNAATGEVNVMGAKFRTVTRADDNSQIPSGCCKACSYKVHVCFSLMVELKAALEVVQATSDEAEEEYLGMPHQMYTCQQCEQEVMGMPDFIQHYEGHIQESTIGVIEPPSGSKGEKEPELPAVDPAALIAEATALIEDGVEDDGLPSFQNELGEYVCELCGRNFKFLFLLVLHRKAPRRGRKPAVAAPVVEESLTCFVCGQAKPNVSQCKLVGGSMFSICATCKTTCTITVV